VLAPHLAPNLSVSLAGGAVRLRDLDFIGAESVDFFTGLRVDYAVFSVVVISRDGDMRDFNMAEERVRESIFACARHRILVVDQSKIGSPAPHAFGKLWHADTVVCGGAMPAAIIDEARHADAQLVCL